MKRKILIAIMIIAFVCILCGVVLIFQKQNLTEGTSTDQNEDDSTLVDEISIDVNNETGYSVIANSIDSNQSLGILIKSNEDTNQMLKITIEFLNQDDTVVFTSNVYESILGQSYYAASFPYVDENGSSFNVKSVRIQINKQGNYFTGLGTNSITLDYSNHVDSNKLKTTLSLTYQADFPINDVTGNVVVLKENKIVAMTSFLQKDIESGVSTNVTIPDIEFSDSENIENLYDKILVFVNSFGFSTES